MNILNKLKNKLTRKSQKKPITYYHAIPKTVKPIDKFTDNEYFNIKYKVIEPIYEKVDRGAYIILDTETDKKYVLKIKNDIGTDHEVYNLLMNNKHQNVISYEKMTLPCLCDDISGTNPLLTSNTNQTHCYIYEYCEGINLAKFVSRSVFLSNDEIKHIFTQIVNATMHIHSLGIIHCDLKLENIIIDKDHNIKVIDFDLSIICNDCKDYVTNTIFGTMQYIAPESYDLCIYSRKSDVWCIGVILYVLITKKFPNGSELTVVNSYNNLRRRNIFKHIDFTYLTEIVEKYNYDKQFIETIKRMLLFEDTKRISVDEIII